MKQQHDPWQLVWGQPYIDADRLATALESDLQHAEQPDFRTRLLVRDAAQAIKSFWGARHFNNWLASSPARKTIAAILKEDLGKAGYHNIRERLVSTISATQIGQIFDLLGQRIHERVEVNIAGSIPTLIRGLTARPTDDIDFVNEVPQEIRQQRKLIEQIKSKYGLLLGHVQSHYLPANWQQRRQFFGDYGGIRVFLVDPIDIFVSKLSSKQEKHQDDLRVLAPQFDKVAVKERLERDGKAFLENPFDRPTIEQNWRFIYQEPLFSDTRIEKAKKVKKPRSRKKGDMQMAKKKKVRVELRKNRSKPPRQRDWTSKVQDEGGFTDGVSQERVRAKGDLSRKRTIMQDEGGDNDADMPRADVENCVPGRVLRVHGLQSVVQTEDGRLHRCAVRRLLKSLSMDERSVVVTGDRVWIRSAENDEGFIERVEPRHGILTRSSRGREHVLVANVDQVVIVVSLVEPALKPHLIDRYLASAEQGRIKPIICLNKADLADPVEYQPLVGFYSQLGIPTLLTSCVTGANVERLRRILKNKTTVFSGQSGVGKSSLLNAIEPGLELKVREVSDSTQKGKHTTTFAQLIVLESAEGGEFGWVVDTPGIRQFELWDIIPEEVEGFFPELHPYVHLCAFPDCTHTHEERCAVKAAVNRRQISERRYTSYLGLFQGSMEELRD